jgi:hypothetical protein
MGLRVRALLIPLLEALDAAGRVHQLLLSGEERMALAADLETQLFLRRSSGKRLAARAVDEDFVVFRVQILLHLDRLFPKLKTVIIAKNSPVINNAVSA